MGFLHAMQIRGHAPLGLSAVQVHLVPTVAMSTTSDGVRYDFTVDVQSANGIDKELFYGTQQVDVSLAGVETISFKFAGVCDQQLLHGLGTDLPSGDVVDIEYRSDTFTVSLYVPKNPIDSIDPSPLYPDPTLVPSYSVWMTSDAAAVTLISTTWDSIVAAVGELVAAETNSQLVTELNPETVTSDDGNISVTLEASYSYEATSEPWSYQFNVEVTSSAGIANTILFGYPIWSTSDGTHLSEFYCSGVCDLERYHSLGTSAGDYEDRTEIPTNYRQSVGSFYRTSTDDDLDSVIEDFWEEIIANVKKLLNAEAASQSLTVVTDESISS